MSGGPSWSLRPATATTPSAWPARIDHADRQTGEVRTIYDSDREPDGVLLKACGTRRESRCHTREAKGRLVLPYHPFRQGARCPHGNRAGCWHRHDEDDPRLGEPLCAACPAPGLGPRGRRGRG